MGLLHSMMGYLKSFYSPQTKMPQLSQTKITICANKLIHTLRFKQIKIQQEAKNLQSNLLVTMNGPKASKSMAGEQQLMGIIVRKSELVAAYQQIIRCANVIKNQARMLENDPNNISQACKLAICTIIYGYKDLQLSQCINLSDFVPEPHPVINKKQISQALRQYVDYNGATFFAINTYILQMCARNQLTLEKINECGHNFQYNPSKLAARQSKSSAMFALSLQQLDLPELQMNQNNQNKMKQMQLYQ